MGFWGNGNFDSDTALDFLDDFEKVHLLPVIHEIERVMAKSGYIEPYEWEGVAVMCSVEILCHFAEQIGCRLPRPETISRWRRRYLSDYDSYMTDPQLFDPEVPRTENGRRAVVVKTWDRLEQLSRQEHERPLK